MKQSREIIQNKLFVLLILLFSMPVLAVNVGRVTDVKGEVFLLTLSGQTKKLHKGDILKDFSEVMTADNGSLSYEDFYNHEFHLSPSSHVTVMNKIMELKNGHIWVQSKSDNDGYSVQTSNAVTAYSEGEFIMSYDNFKRSSQVMVVSGIVKFFNINEEHLSYDITAGNFSSIDQTIEKGFPRTPTFVGYESYNKLVQTFMDIQPMDKSLKGILATVKKKAKVDGRTIASVGLKETVTSFRLMDLNQKGKGKGAALIIRKPQKLRKPASSEGYNYFMKVDKKGFKKYMPFKGETAKVRVFGGVNSSVKSSSYSSENVKVYDAKPVVVTSTPQVVSKPSKRLPSSIKKVDIEMKKPLNQQENLGMFKDSLLKEYIKQKKHKDEVNNLIDELKMYSDKYDKNY